jgi:hypothetical protein
MTATSGEGEDMRLHLQEYCLAASREANSQNFL